MRTVRYSLTAERMFHAMLHEGAEKFGVDVAEEKRRLLVNCVRDYLAEHPHHGLRTRGKSFLHYPVQSTPFTVVYDYDNNELRVLYILHKRADRRNLTPTNVDW